MKILVTGFDPFEGDSINPAFEAVKLLPDRIEGAEIVKLEIPTSYRRSFEVTSQAIETHRPDVVLCIGQAGGRAAITPEKVAINLAEARIPDNDQDQPINQPLVQEGETAYFSSLPVKAMVSAMLQAGILAEVSYTAGTFVCNAIMYHVLHLAASAYPHMKAGFIHLPYLPEQVAGLPEIPSMHLHEMVQGLEVSIQAIINPPEEVSLVSGTIC